jgi:hypothetical protein
LTNEKITNKQPMLGSPGKVMKKLPHAWREKRMTWTHDRDFLDDTLLPEHRNPGVVVLHGGDGSLVSLVGGLQTALTVFGHGGQVWSKTKSTVNPDGEMTIRSRNAAGK